MSSEQPPPYSTDPLDQSLIATAQEGTQPSGHGDCDKPAGEVTAIINGQFQPGYPEQPPSYLQDAFPVPTVPPPGYSTATKTVSGCQHCIKTINLLQE